MKARKRTALVADGYPPVARLIGAILEREGFDVEISQDGEAVLGRLGRGTYSIVIAEWHLPRGSGLAIAREIRRRDDTTSVLLVSGGEQAPWMRSVVAGLPRIGILEKPFGITELVEATTRILGEGARLPELPGAARNISLPGGIPE